MIAADKIAAQVATAERPGQALHQAGGAAASPVSLTMPMPPSVNNAFRNLARGGRAKTQATKDWESHALWHVKAQRLPVVTGPVLVVFGFERRSVSADVDNRVKLALDLLVKAGVIEDDRFVVGGAFSWLPPANGLCHITVARAGRATVEFVPSQDGAAGAWLLAPPPSEGDRPWR